MIHRTIQTDLLSIGGSGAGVMAAVHAARQGLDVTLVSKGKLGRSGNVIMAGGGFGIDGESGAQILGDRFSDPSFTREKMFDCLLKESFYLADQNMITQYVEESAPAVKDYLDWAQSAGCTFLRTKPCGWMSSGLLFARALREGVKETSGIRLLEDVSVAELLTRDGAVTGAIAVDVYTGGLIEIQAEAVVIGTGGYQPFSMKNTVSDMTGDGQAMAYRAGARLTDMEFMLAFPTAVVPQHMKGSIYPFIFEFFMPKLQYKIVDKNGAPLPIPQEIIDLTRGTKLSKLASSYYMGNAIDQGLGGPNGGVFYDYSAYSKEELDDSFASFHARFNQFHKDGYYKGESLDRVKEIIYAGQPLEVGLGFEYCMGGIEVNEKMETGIPGLFAAGEVTSGVFGACRAGDGLTEMLCQGMRAGLSAAAYCRSSGQKGKNDPEAVRRACGRLLQPFQNQGGMDPVTLYNQIEAACDEGFSVIRCEEGLQQSLEKITALKVALKTVSIRQKSRAYNFEWMRAMQAENLIVCCEAGIRAALARRESRGCHIRKDFPQVDHDHYLHKYVFSRGEEGMRMETRKPVATRAALPSGTRPDVIAYFLDKNLHYKR